ncbi:hypothetical protein J2D73_10770 [Acetobacter sacchari]|uniref:DUF6878 domain-containing protein n=1 Tax=Acetobacter sacchari TaxID=2661687 RepID=A0ABS3LWI6_9PROT|nr:DUF6878 family protein [Acetobacter sacchari]MBO1360269.1 hypothetical protein [Acetobacter sacchari]
MTTTPKTNKYDIIRAFYEAQEKQSFAHNRETLFVALQARGVAKVSVTYCGSGDSGAVEDCTIEPGDAALTGTVSVLTAQWDQTEPRVDDKTLKDAVEEMAMQLVEIDHSAGESRKGGRKTVTFDVVARKITATEINAVTDAGGDTIYRK